MSPRISIFTFHYYQELARETLKNSSYWPNPCSPVDRVKTITENLNWDDSTWTVQKDLACILPFTLVMVNHLMFELSSPSRLANSHFSTLTYSQQMTNKDQQDSPEVSET